MPWERKDSRNKFYILLFKSLGLKRFKIAHSVRKKQQQTSTLPFLADRALEFPEGFERRTRQRAISPTPAPQWQRIHFQTILRTERLAASICARRELELLQGKLQPTLVWGVLEPGKV